jgi:transposase
MSTKRKNKKYSFELKLEVVQRALAGEPIRILAKEFEVSDPDYIYVWIEKYQTYGEVGLMRKKRNLPRHDKEARIYELEMENDILKKYLEIQREEENKQNLR